MSADMDPRLALELAVATEYRLPYSEFLSWPVEVRDKIVSFYLRHAWGSW